MGIIKNLSRIGNLPQDDENVALRKQFLIYQGLFMSGGGLLWGTLLFVFHYPIPSVIPYGYAFITIINFYAFGYTKNFIVCRNVQTTISLLLPFLLQWFLGGFLVSGGVMLWSMLSLTSSVTYQNIRASIFWLLAFIALTLFSLIYDSYFREHFNMNVPAEVSLVFWVVNVLCISGILFILMLYSTQMNFLNMKKVKQTYSQLIASEKLAALGQVSAGIAHEVNTPLGAIKSSAEESAHAFRDVLLSFAWMINSLEEKQREQFLNFVLNVNPNTETFSTKEEREIKKKMRDRLNELGIENANFLSDRLVQVGIYDVNPELEQLTRFKDFEKLVMLTYNILNLQRSNQTVMLAVDKASRLVKALKTYLYSSGNSEMEPINLRDNLETVLTIYHNRLKQGVQVIKNYEDIPEVYGFPDQLNQVWTNLIVNAVQAMDNKGILSIGIKKEGEYVLVSIKDTGRGIPKAIQDKIFDPFFTTKVSGEGSGLGLDIIQRILKDHYGHISFQTVEGQGTTFFVKLPLKKMA
jgi:signal transduction histidine kinase